jgi:predicted transcriptional regulator
VLVRAMETRDVDTATRYVYFDAVRVSLTNQVVAAYLRRTKINVSPLAQSMAARALGIADPIVKKLVIDDIVEGFENSV